MLREAFALMRKKTMILGAAAYFAVFSAIYLLLDRLNGGYPAMAETYGAGLVAANILLNVVMAGLTAFLMTLSTAYVKLSGREGTGTFLGSAAVFFGMLTYGCTSCVISFFAAIGISFTVAVLPLAGLPYKLIALAIVVLGVVLLVLEVRRGRCRIRRKHG